MAEFRHVDGLSALRDTLRRLPPQLRKSALTGATGAAAAPVRDDAIEHAPEWHGDPQKGHPPPGTLKKSIVMRYAARQSNDQRVTFLVFVQRNAKEKTQKTTQRSFDPTTGKQSLIRYSYTEKSTVGGAYYWWWVEFGNSKMGGQHYMRSALQNAAAKGIDAFRDKLQAALPALAAQARA